MFKRLSSGAAASKIASGTLPGLVAVLAAGFAAAGPQSSSESDGLRQSTTKHFATGGRAQSAPTTITEDRFGALVTDGQREKPSAGQRSGKTGSSAQAPGNDFWIFFADVILFGDDDHDGFSYGIDLLFDADTIFEVADVYAVLYLSLEGGPWNEYAATEDFTIFGATSDDEYVVVTELESGYPTGSYDLLIELYDAVDGAFLASLGPEDTSELSFLPLEDFNRDDPHFDVPIAHSHSGGGAMNPAMLVFLLLATAAMYRSRRPCNRL